MSSVAKGNSTNGVVGKVLLWGILLFTTLYVSRCSYVSHRQTSAFDAISNGDREDKVVRLLGEPFVRERRSDPPFGRYSSYACVTPCSERLWYENRMGFVGEAWSVDLDADRRVIDTARWVSP